MGSFELILQVTSAVKQLSGIEHKRLKSMTESNNPDYSQEELDNHSNQLNPNNDAYWSSRGEERPDDYESEISGDEE